MKFELSEQDLINQYPKEIKALLKALGHPDALVTDDSLISDFLDIFSNMEQKEKQLARIGNKIGIMVCDSDPIWHIIKLMAKAKKGDGAI